MPFFIAIESSVLGQHVFILTANVFLMRYIFGATEGSALSPADACLAVVGK